MQKRKLGIAVIGVGGAVGTTMAAGIELLRQGLTDTTGLPLANEPGLVPYEEIAISGWDLFKDNLAAAAASHKVLSIEQFSAVADPLSRIVPWQAVGNLRYVETIDGENKIAEQGLRAIVERLRADIRTLRDCCESAVVINLASTERLVEPNPEIHNSLAAFDAALDADSTEISPAMLYAYAAISEGVPYGNFTPSLAADLPAIVELAEKCRVPVAGKDGKTGQTFLKTVLAPAFKSRALKIEGWYSTNLLGNRDGQALANEGSLASKIKTKASVLDEILGYDVEDHIVDIRYYRPRGDDKEAWDNIDIKGFLGGRMQVKINFLCKDSILAAPLAIEIARCLDYARRRGESGIQEQLSAFFKLPMSRSGKPIHAFHKQMEMLMDWLRQ